MPVEIKELVIRAVTTADTDEAATAETDEDTGEEVDEDMDEVPLGQASAIDTEAIVQECVKQVLRILQKKAER